MYSIFKSFISITSMCTTGYMYGQTCYKRRCSLILLTRTIDRYMYNVECLLQTADHMQFVMCVLILVRWNYNPISKSYQFSHTYAPLGWMKAYCLIVSLRRQMSVNEKPTTMRVEVYTADSLMGELVCITCIINWINKHWLLPRRN